MPIQSITAVSLQRGIEQAAVVIVPVPGKVSVSQERPENTSTVDLAGDTEKRTCDTMRSPRRKKEEKREKQKREKQKREKRSDKLPISGFKNHYKLPMVGGFRTLHRK